MAEKSSDDFGVAQEFAMRRRTVFERMHRAAAEQLQALQRRNKRRPGMPAKPAVDFRKLLRDVIRGAVIDSDYVPVPIGGPLAPDDAGDALVDYELTENELKRPMRIWSAK
jgi:hypothetical protein